MTFDFQEALSYMKAGFKVKYMDDIYYIDNEGTVKVLTLDNSKVHFFPINQIMSNNWMLVDE